MKRALILKFGQIGDVIMAVPGVRSLYDEGYSIDWVCGAAARPLLASFSWINIIPVDDRAILRGSLPARLRAVAQLWRRTCLVRYDLCATLYYDRRLHLLSAPVRAKKKIALSREHRATTLVAGRHHTDEFRRVLQTAVHGTEDGCKDTSTPPLRPDTLPPAPLAPKKAPVRIAIAAGGTSNVVGDQVLRRWPVESYAQVAEQLVARGWELLLIGGPDDSWVRPSFHHLPVLDLIGKLSLPEVVSVCDSCDVVITHDAGPLHLAGLSQAGVLGIFGPVDPWTRIPRRPHAVGIWGGEGFACRPCYDGRNFAPCRFNGCMHQVTPELVLRELDQMLDARIRGNNPPWRIVCPYLTRPGGLGAQLTSWRQEHGK